MASKRAGSILSTLFRAHLPSINPKSVPITYFRPRQRNLPPQLLRPPTSRFAHTIPRPPEREQPLDPTADPDLVIGKPQPTSQRKRLSDDDIALSPHYELTFTCVPCSTRSEHRISKQGYHHGSVLITCPGCRNRHVISDHLGVFGETAGKTVEDLVREKGQLVKRGTLGEDGDVEFWQDGTQTVREERRKEEEVRKYEAAEGSDGDERVPGETFGSVRPGGKSGEE